MEFEYEDYYETEVGNLEGDYEKENVAIALKNIDLSLREIIDIIRYK